MVDNEALDATIEQRIQEARQGIADSRNKLNDVVQSLLGSTGIKADSSLTAYIVSQLVDNNYCERNNQFSFNDRFLDVGAISVPATSSTGKPLYTSGDSHFFYKPSPEVYVLGLLDGKDHGPSAMMIVLAARKYLDDIVHEGISDTVEMAEILNSKMRAAKISFTTMFMSVLKNKRVSVTNAGSKALLYRDGIGILHQFPNSGLAPGMLDTNILKLKKPYISEEISLNPKDVLVAYTDGIFERDGFNVQGVEEQVKAGPNALPIAKGIYAYAANLPKQGSSDDATVVVTIVR